MSSRTVDSVFRDFLKISWDASLLNTVVRPPASGVDPEVRLRFMTTCNEAGSLARFAELSGKNLQDVANFSSSGDFEDLLIFASAQVAALRERMADIADIGYPECLPGESARKAVAEVTERYAPYKRVHPDVGAVKEFTLKPNPYKF